jgi:hypothetical protein
LIALGLTALAIVLAVFVVAATTLVLVRAPSIAMVLPRA